MTPELRQRLLVGLTAVVSGAAIAAVVVLVVLLVSDDSGSQAGGDGESTPTVVVPDLATADGPEPELTETADAYTLLLDDLEQPSNVNREATFGFGPEGYTLVSLFSTPSEAQTSLGEWGFSEAFFVEYEPVGLVAGVAGGRHFLRVETYRFETADGARQAMEFFNEAHFQSPEAEAVEVEPVGNSWFATRIERGTVGDTDLEAAFERTVFRRGNLVAIVQTNGAASNMPRGISRAYAAAIDAKALGDAPAATPTPAGEGTPAPPVIEDPSATPFPG